MLQPHQRPREPNEEPADAVEPPPRRADRLEAPPRVLPGERGLPQMDRRANAVRQLRGLRARLRASARAAVEILRFQVSGIRQHGEIQPVQRHRQQADKDGKQRRNRTATATTGR